MQIRSHMLVLLALVGAAVVLPAQSRTVRPKRDDGDRTYTMLSRRGVDPDRARLGITIESTGAGDTLGPRVADVSEGSPAAKAGLQSGDRITAINGVSLRVSRDDAEDASLAGLASRRLTREMARHEPGDTVELHLMRDGTARTVKVATVAAEELEPALATVTRRLRPAAERASLGIGFVIGGSVRDTSGIFVSSVSPDGPAEKAGVVEGDRIAAINGVDLRVPREDAGDWATSNARVRRLSRELEKVKPGDEVELRVMRAGQSRMVKVKTASARDVDGAGRRAFIIGDGSDLSGFSFDALAPMPLAPRVPMPPDAPHPPKAPMPPTAPLPPEAPRAPRLFWYEGEGEGEGEGRIRLRLSPEDRLELRNRIELRGDVRQEIREALERALERGGGEAIVRPRVRVRVSDTV